MKTLSAEDMVEYLTECTLATVDDLAHKKRPPKHEFDRQMSIAQSGINWLKEHDHKPRKGLRVDEAMVSTSVAHWAHDRVER